MEKTVKIVAEQGDRCAGYEKVCVRLPDGSEIPNVFKIEWLADVNGEIPHAVIYTHCTEVEIETRANVVAVCPMCKKEIEDSKSRMPTVTETGETKCR